MDFKEFMLAMACETQKRLPGDVEARPQVIQKNNGVKLQGLLFQRKGQRSAPTIYLEPYYQAFLEGTPLSVLASEMAGCCRDCVPDEEIRAEHFLQYETVRSTLVYKLVNYRQNERLLKEIPHLPYLDLAMVFCSLFEHPRMGKASIWIHNSHLEMWGISHSRLYADARENTPRLLRAKLVSMWETLPGLALCPEARKEEPPFYVLTNEEQKNGAACLLYPGMLERCEKLCKGEFFVLPSSVHETLVLPYSRGMEAGKLKAMVREVNRSQVDPQEVLSDLVYFYSREKKKLLLL